MSFPSTNSGKFSSVRRLNASLIIGNATGIVLYLVLASRGWVIPQEHGMVPVTGEPFVWADALPVIGIFFVLDVIWGGLLLRHREWKVRSWWLVVVFMWVIAVIIDFSHH